jgi:hypothetical protein
MIRARNTVVIALTAMLVGVLAVGSASGAATRAEYIAQADPVCAKDLRLQHHALKGFFADLSRERWAPAARKLSRSIPPYVKMIDKLKGISPPSADAEALGKWVKGLSSQVPLARRLVSALHGGVRGKIDKRNRALFSASSKTMGIVRGYGFISCDEV